MYTLRTMESALRYWNPSTNEAEVPLSYERINDEITQKELDESKRLLFVAVTRAQEHLILSGV